MMYKLSQIRFWPCRYENEFDFQTILTTTTNISNEPFMNVTLYCELDLQKLSKAPYYQFEKLITSKN